MIVIILLTGCSQKEPVLNCYYPDFPSPNAEVKDILKKEIKKEENKELLKWFDKVLKHKEKLEVLKSGKQNQ